MKIPKKHSKSTILATLAYCLLAITCFYSCDKTEKLNGSTWVGTSNFTDRDGHSGEVTLHISFTENNADIIAGFKYYSADEPIICKGKATYECDKNYITIKMKLYNDNNGYYLFHYWRETNWSGSFDKNTMNLREVVFDRTVRFMKQ